MAALQTFSPSCSDISSQSTGQCAPKAGRSSSMGAEPYAVAPPSSRHQRSLTEGQRRPSLLQLRSRSNTMNVSNGPAYSKHSMSPELAQETCSPRGSSERPRNGLIKGERPESLRKGLIAKSSKLFRRPRSKDDLTSLRPLDLSDEFDHDICPAPVEAKMPEKAPSRPVSRHFKKISKAEESALRRNISEPFNFQHLTHTDPRQYQKIQESPHDDLVSEFSAMRAAQPPRRELQGIKAESISPRGEFYLDTSSSETSSPPQTRDGFSTPPVRTPTHEKSFSPVRSLHRAMSIDSLSECSRPPSRDPTSPPSRSNSQFFSPEFFTIHEGSPMDTVLPTEYHTPREDSTGFDYPIATWNSGVYDFAVPHAVTTPDDAAMPLRPPPFQMVRTELAKVLEEDESSEGRRSSAAATTILPTPPSSGLRQAKSSPNLRRSPQKNVHAAPSPVLLEPPSFDVRPSSIFESTATDIPYRPKSCEPPPTMLNKIETSWEDDIDWCYNHEAEADCDFDWLNEPTTEVNIATDEDGHVEIEQDAALKLSPCSITPTQPQTPYHASSLSSSRPVSPTSMSQQTSSMYSASPLILPTENCVPDLEPPSAVSAQSSFDSMSEAVTPVEVSGTDLNKRFLRAACKPTCQDCPPGSMDVMENDPEATMVYEDLFHVIYARNTEPEQRFSIGPVDGSSTSSTSPRSSHTLISNSSSQESFWSRHHGYSVSGSSVPDLIHSKQPVADQLAERLTGLDAAFTAETGGQAITHRRRSPSLAKDVAQKCIISKVMSRQSILDDEDSRVPVSSRSRAASDASFHNLESTTPPRLARPQSTRARSSSSAASIRSTSSATRRYSLFPATNVRDQIKAGMI